MPDSRLTTHPFAPTLDPTAIADLRARLRRTRRARSLGQGWDRGMPPDWLTGLLDDWLAFDVDAFQACLDGLNHLRAEVDGQAIHAVRADGAASDPAPLLLIHGWPGSFLEYLDIIPLLTDPDAHDGDPADAFTVVVPSLPGFGLSDPPAAPDDTARTVAGRFHRLMTDGLGFRRYFVHGSDLGAGIAAWLARDHPESVTAISLATPGLVVVPGPRDGTEDAFDEAARTWTRAEGGYMHEHSTKPATLAAGLSDSPAGLAAWIGEKWWSWSSVRPDGAPGFDGDRLLQTLTLYWATNTIATSLLPYWAFQHADASLPAGDASPVPTAFTNFGGERVPFPKPPRSLAERYFTLDRFAEHDVGGHFPAMAEPGLLAGILRDAFRRFR